MVPASNTLVQQGGLLVDCVVIAAAFDGLSDSDELFGGRKIDLVAHAEFPKSCRSPLIVELDGRVPADRPTHATEEPANDIKTRSRAQCETHK